MVYTTLDQWLWDPPIPHPMFSCSGIALSRVAWLALFRSFSVLAAANTMRKAGDFVVDFHGGIDYPSEDLTMNAGIMGR
jgi:hypothetical protein